MRPKRWAPYSGGPFRVESRRVTRRRGPPGGGGSGTARTGRALRNNASMISGLVHRSGPQRVNRCSRSESSLVNRSTRRGDGPSNDGTTVSSRATSSAVHRLPLGSVCVATNPRRLGWSIAPRVGIAQQKSKDWSAITSGFATDSGLLLSRPAVEPAPWTDPRRRRVSRI